MNIYSGNIHLKASEEVLLKLFEKFGNTELVIMILNKKGRQFQGLGFEEKLDKKSIMKAIGNP